MEPFLVMDFDILEFVKVFNYARLLDWTKRLRAYNYTHNAWQTIAYKPMHWPDSITWTTHTEESTTLLEATRLQEAQLCTTLH